jgi:hypothetical protein
VEAKRSWIDWAMVFVLFGMLAGGVAAVVAATWALIPNHALALVAVVVVVPLFLWGLTQDE